MSESDADADDDFKALLENSFLRNEISSVKFAEFVKGAKRCKIKGLSKLRLASNASKKNLKRNLMKTIGKQRKIGVPLWYVKVPLDGSEHKIPFVLPHLLIKYIEKISFTLKPLMYRTTGSSSSGDVSFELHNRMKNTAADLGAQCDNVIAVGMHGDGTPFGKKDSLEVLSLNFCFWKEGSNIRFPLVAIPKRHMISATWNAVLNILGWSFKILAHGKVFKYEGFDDPLNRHAIKLSPIGSAVPKTFLVQLRADWAFLKVCYKLPQHNENNGICHLCRAVPGNWDAFGDDAEWRKNRFTDQDSFHKYQLEQNISPCALWQIPGVSSEIIDLDWLHVADIGVAADIAGNVLEAVLPHLNGKNNAERLQTLNDKAAAWYKAQGIIEKLDKFKLESWRADKKPPKLKGKAAAVRKFVPFLFHLASDIFKDSDDMYHQTIISLTSNLNDAYSCLINWDKHKLATACRRTLILYKSLRDYSLSQDENTRKWHLMPKCHQWQELCEFQCFKQDLNPKFTWCYKDEDFGGYLVRTAARRGGPNSARSVALDVYHRFFSLNRIPQFLESTKSAQKKPGRLRSVICGWAVLLHVAGVPRKWNHESFWQ